MREPGSTIRPCRRWTRDPYTSTQSIEESIQDAIPIFVTQRQSEAMARRSTCVTVRADSARGLLKLGRPHPARLNPFDQLRLFRSTWGVYSDSESLRLPK